MKCLVQLMALILYHEYNISEPVLDAVESNKDFLELCQSPEYGFFGMRIKSGICILDARVVSLVLNANNCCYRLFQHLNLY